MNPFSWLRKAVAESVAAGVHDGLAQVQRDFGCERGAMDLESHSAPTSSMPPVEIDEIQPEELAAIEASKAAPLAAFVQQLGIGTTRSVPGLPAATSGEKRRKPGRPRKHNHDPA